MNFQELQNSLSRFPVKLSQKEFYPVAYRFMLLSRKMDQRFVELFKKGYAKGTVTTGVGNEATAIGGGFLFRPGQDVLSILHRDVGIHLAMGMDPFYLFCQYMANQDSPTHGREGNVHHGDAKTRRFPMMSHLGNMLATVVGGVWQARRNSEDIFGLAVIGDGGSSTGDFHESLNIASVRGVPVLYLIENNHYAYSTPTKYQYHCAKLSDRAAGYGIQGKTIDGTDVWAVYEAVYDALQTMTATSLPYILECMTLRLEGHAAYDKAEYVTQEEKTEWQKREPIVKTRDKLHEVCGLLENDIQKIETEIQNIVDMATDKALKSLRIDPKLQSFKVYAPSTVKKVKPFESPEVRNLNAVTLALDYILSQEPSSFLLGEDIGPFGSAFKTCKGLFDKFGPSRVLDMPVCESAQAGFALGATQTGGKPILEYQFADFATEAVTQIGLNSATWYFRTGVAAPVLFRLPCGGGITLGAFHSAEFEGLWSRFPGLKLIYPYTTQEVFEALVAGFYDPNPCVVFEHKFLYANKKGTIQFDGNLQNIFRPRKYTDGKDITVIAIGNSLSAALSVANEKICSLEVWNPFILQPLEMAPIEESLQKTGKLLLVQESGETAGLGDKLISILTRKCFKNLRCAPQIISALDIPVPFAPELESFYLPGIEKIRSAVLHLTKQ